MTLFEDGKYQARHQGQYSESELAKNISFAIDHVLAIEAQLDDESD